MEEKELKAYLLDVRYDIPTHGAAIEKWVDYEIKNNKLHKEAEEFIDLCEEKGTIFSLKGLTNFINFNEGDIHHFWIYITDKY